MSKYHSTPTEVNGIRFDSKREANRWAELKLLERGHVITDLRRQVRYIIAPQTTVEGVKFTTKVYVADFVYHKDGKLVVEDVKGYRTQEYKLKRHLMALNYQILVVET